MISKCISIACIALLSLQHLDAWGFRGHTVANLAAVEAISRVRGTEKIKQDYHRIAERRGKNIARVAAARRLLTLVYYGLRDGEIRCLASHNEAG